MLESISALEPLLSNDAQSIVIRQQLALVVGLESFLEELFYFTIVLFHIIAVQRQEVG